MGAAINFIVSPSGVVLSLLVGAVWIWGRPDSIGARRFLVASAVAYPLASAYIVPYAVGRWLTSGFHAFTPADVGPGRTAIVVLGSGDRVVAGRDQQVSVMLPNSAARVLEAVRVFHLIEPAWIVSSGGHPDPHEIGEPIGVTMTAELVQFGVPASRIVLEATSRDTHDEAVVVTRMLHRLGVTQVVIVTSETHMPRSLGAFRAQGWNPIPATAPTSTVDMTLGDRWLPTGRGLDLSAEVVHELGGIPYYWGRGWWRR